MLDYLDLRIVEGIETYGPRNLLSISKNLGVPATTVRRRINRLLSKSLLFLTVNTYHTNLGLKKAVVFVEANQGYEELLGRCLTSHDFYSYVYRCYGPFEGYHAVFTIPKEHMREFEVFLDEVKRLGAARIIRLFWSTCFHRVRFSLSLFDKNLRTWVFPWDKWMEQVMTSESSPQLPYTLVDPEDFPIRADKLDLLILNHLFEDPTIDMVELAKKVGLTSAGVIYHFKEHVVGHRLIEGYQAGVPFFDLATSDFFVFIFTFESEEKLARLASSFEGKAFVFSLGKVLGGNALIATVYLPRMEFRKFVGCLSQLVRNSFIKSYEYVILDFGRVKHNPIPLHLFQDNSWVYDHEKHLRNLHNVVSE